MRKLLYALAAAAAIASLAAFGTASAAPAHPAGPAAHAVVPDNLPAGGKCFQITDADGGGYGSLYYNGSQIVTSHSNHTAWCPYGPLVGGWQLLQDPTGGGGYSMATHYSGNYLTEYQSEGGNPTCNFGAVPYSSLPAANGYCEWAESINSSGNWTIESGDANIPADQYITATGSGKPVDLNSYNKDDDQHWAITCVRNCNS